MTRRSAAVIALLVVALAVAVNLALVTDAAAPRSTKLYSLGGTVKCLTRAGARVSAIGSSDAQFKALHDLAQRTSRKIVLRRQTVGLAVVDTEATAKLLVELLAPPNTDYLVTRRLNAIVLYRVASRRAVSAAVACLR